MSYKTILLTVAVVFFVLVFFRSSPYEQWYKGRIETFATTIYDEIDKLDIETRKRERWASAYILFDDIRDKRGQKFKDSLLLIPYGKYQKRFTEDLVMPEPITIYYFTGLRTVFHHRDTARKAKAVLTLGKSSYSISPVTDTALITLAINEYTKP